MPLAEHFFLNQILERVRGIEPLYAAWEAAVLPLNYTRRALNLSLLDALSRPLNVARPTHEVACAACEQ